MGINAKAIRYTQIHAVQSVRKIQKCWLKAQIFKKIREDIGVVRTYHLLKFIKFMKSVYSKKIKEKKMKRVVNHFMINNFKTRIRTKMGTVISKIHEIQKFAR